MYYYRNRFYSTTLGRVMHTDPIGPADNANLYAYVDNDPVNATDPLGLEECVGDCTTPIYITLLISEGGGGSGGASNAGSNSFEPEDQRPIIVTGRRTTQSPVVTAVTSPPPRHNCVRAQGAFRKARCPCDSQL